MIIDAHVHAFPNWETGAGYRDAQAFLMFQQRRIKNWWGKMLTNSLEEKYIPLIDEEIDFRFGKYGRFNWTKHGKACWLQRFPTIMDQFEWPPEKMIAFMDEIGVDMGVLQAGYMEPDYCTHYFADCMQKFPGRFIGTVFVDYDIKKDREHREREIGKLRDAVHKFGMRGIFQGWSRGLETRYSIDPIDDPNYEPFWEELSQLRIPYIFFIGFQAKAQYLESIDRIERVLKNFPKVNGIIGHLGGNIRPPADPNNTETPKELLKILKLPNLYFEVGYVLAYENWEIWKENYQFPYPLHKEVIKEIYDEVGAERLLWASDMPNLYRTCTYRQCLDLVRLHFDFLKGSEKHLVLGGNAARLFRT